MTGRVWKDRLESARRAAAIGACLVALSGCAASPAPPAEAASAPATPQSPLGSYLAARHAQQMHDYAAAARYVDRALAADPGNFDLVRRAFLLRIEEGRVTEAVPLAQRIVDLDRNASLAALVLMVDDIKAGDFAKAAAQAEAMPQDGAQRFAVPLLLAWSDLGRQRPAPAVQALQPIAGLHGLESLQQLHLALLSDAAGRIDDAAQAYGKLTADTPLTWRVVELAGNFLERHGRSAEARRLYERFAAGEGDPDLVTPGLARIAQGKVPPPVVAAPRDGAAQALFDLATLLDRRETIEGAMLYVRLSLYLDPSLPLSQMLLAEIEGEEHHPEAALAIYRDVDPASPLAWTARLRGALLLDQMGRTNEAVTALRGMAAERPKRDDALIALGDLLRSRSRFAEAVEAYDQAIARLGEVEGRDWRVFYSRGVALERSATWPRAEADLKRALALQPDQPSVLNYLGYSWIDRGENLDEALRMIERAVALRPDDGYIVDSLGWAFYRLGEFPKATQYLERAIELLPEDPTINDHLGDAYWRVGRLAEARFQWRRALQFRPEADQVKTIETKLDRGLGGSSATTARGG